MSKGDLINMSNNDTTEIIQIINLYGLALDSHSWDLMPEIFTEDVIADFGPAGALWVGVEKLTYAFKIFHETLDNHMHTMYGHVVHVEGDKAHAFTYGDWLLVRDLAEGGPSWLGRGWYDDELVRTEKGWRISKRVCRLASWSGNPSVPQPSYEQHPVMDTFVVRKFREEGKLETLKVISAK
ncbi:nuclear transport factor 2 family protein [Clostridium estertheticum]|uniref:nuclear transport factor 2 family protein n=1 Tax=Clostridium estertheticum TaxID=238834 RepID=UPI001920EC5D|nr:nuclear transport factor 2 family protein [Clostridium estertheticum]MBZ9685221.1 nuclear transport factor 2 family protein [Clostridium estertheticum]